MLAICLCCDGCIQRSACPPPQRGTRRNHRPSAHVRRKACRFACNAQNSIGGPVQRHAKRQASSYKQHSTGDSTTARCVLLAVFFSNMNTTTNDRLRRQLRTSSLVLQHSSSSSTRKPLLLALRFGAIVSLLLLFLMVQRRQSPVRVPLPCSLSLRDG